MIAYKGFNKDLICTMGRGSFRYEVGKTYTEEHADTANRGFHCVEEPIETLRWYSGAGKRYCIVLAAGDINEKDDKISCTTMKILKEISLEELGILECQWIMDHPERRESTFVQRESGEAMTGIVVVRGKHPRAKGKIGTTLFLLKEKKDERTIEKVGVYAIDGKEKLPDVFYTVTGRRSKCEKKS